MNWITAGVVLVSAILLLITAHNPSAYPIAFALAFLVVFILLLQPALQKRSLKRQFLFFAAPMTTIPIELTFDAEKISFTRPGNSEASFFWSAVQGSAEDERTFIIITAESFFYYVPKRALSSSELDMLRSFAPSGTSAC